MINMMKTSLDNLLFMTIIFTFITKSIWNYVFNHININLLSMTKPSLIINYNGELQINLL